MKKETIWNVSISELFEKVAEDPSGFKLLHYEIDGVMYKFAVIFQGKEKSKK